MKVVTELKTLTNRNPSVIPTPAKGGLCWSFFVSEINLRNTAQVPRKKRLDSFATSLFEEMITLRNPCDYLNKYLSFSNNVNIVHLVLYIITKHFTRTILLKEANSKKVLLQLLSTHCSNKQNIYSSKKSVFH